MPGRQAAVFDFDGTVIRGDSIVALLRLARRQGYLSLPGLAYSALCGILYYLHLMNAMAAKRRSHAFLTRMRPAEREKLLRSFADSLVSRAYPDALRQMAAHHQKGDLVVLCSASCQCYMQYVAPLLGADALLCTPSAPDGQCLGPNCRGQEKVRRVTAWLAENGLPGDAICAAYGDSKGDAPILRASREPVLVNPKKGLKKALPDARQVSWQE